LPDRRDEALNSRQSARRDATGRPWDGLLDVVKPMAPASMGALELSVMSFRSSAGRSKARSAIAQARSAECPTLAA
jgi:hypothetical protein